MGLETYWKKRRFQETPEPEGKPERRKGRLRFVIQKHDATRLHYDFRLEMEGVMKSWAVPKGPSANPADKRLAMMTEDHPISYNTFEGIIPEGNYGAGPVIVWDRGTYVSAETDDAREEERVLLEGLEKGRFSFVMQGEKVKGEYTLTKMHGKERNAWLLIKKDDDAADPQKDLTAQDQSVASGRTIDDVLAGKKGAKAARSAFSSQRSSASVPRKSRAAEASASPMPRNLKPMLATLVDAPFDGKEWLFEWKWDGYRAVAEVEVGQVKLYSRNMLSFNERYPDIVEALAHLGHECVLDGEIIVAGKDGRGDFQLLQNWTRDHEGELQYQVFDLLWLDGYDVRHLPLKDRKKLLEELLRGQKEVCYSEHRVGKGKAFFEQARKAGAEGIMAKRADSPYKTGKRSEDWLKIKTHRRQEVVIGGFTEPRGSRKYIGALLVGVYENGSLTYVGHASAGYKAQDLKALRQTLEKLSVDAPPFSTKPKPNAPVTWVKPKLVCEVKFQEWTDDGVLRQPIFLGLRPDKAPADVHREAETDAQDAKRDAERDPPATVQTRARKDVPKGAMRAKDVPLTHLEKVYFPKEGYTKGDVVEYYRSVADLILPYLKDRPQSLHRHPGGVRGPSFFQKDVHHQVPSWIPTAEVYSDSHGKEINYLLCQDEATLLYLANLGCIEINPWNSRVGSLDNPDYFVIDLDPEDIGFDAVIETAQAVKEVLDRAGIEGYPKTSGKTGIHIFIPLGAGYAVEQAKQFAEVIAHLANALLPDITSIERSPKNRQKKVYLDYLQNNRGQTLAAPYSLRPVDGAPVSTPLRWSEVKKGLDPQDFTLKTIRKRVKKVGDLWKPVLGKGINLEKALKRLS